MTTQTADTILTGGAITTLGAAGEVSAIAIAGERIIAVGDDASVEAMAGPNTTRINLAGRRVIPGLIDSHVHFVRAGLTWKYEARWEELTSLAEALDRIAQKVAQFQAGTWVTVFCAWSPEQFKEKRRPTRAELDAIAPDHPVYVQESYSWGIANSKAIEMLGLDRQKAHTVGKDAFVYDDNGDPTGEIIGREGITWIYTALPKGTLEDQVEGTAELSREMARLGITGISDGGGNGMNATLYRGVYETWRRGLLRTRVRLTVHATGESDDVAEMANIVKYSAPRFGDSMLTLTGAGEVPLYKMHDGMMRPAPPTPEAVSELYEISLGCAAAGWPLQMHVHRPENVKAILDVWSRVNDIHPIRELRWALVHAEKLDEDDLAEIARLGLGIAGQSMFRYAGEIALKAWGEEAVKDCPPFRRIFELGIPIGAGSDGMRANSYNPFGSLLWYLNGLTVAGNRTLRDENLLTREEALRLYTHGSAWFTFEEDERGTLEPGKLADLAVLDGDYMTVSEAEIPRIQSLLTLVGGKAVWAAGDYAEHGSD